MFCFCSERKNCSDGGCPLCNVGEGAGERLDICLCSHAEDNTINEAGRDRCQGSSLYPRLYSCILCATKTVHSRISRLVYHCHYATDTNAEKRVKEGGVILENVRVVRYMKE